MSAVIRGSLLTSTHYSLTCFCLRARLWEPRIFLPVRLVSYECVQMCACLSTKIPQPFAELLHRPNHLVFAAEVDEHVAWHTYLLLVSRSTGSGAREEEREKPVDYLQRVQQARNRRFKSFVRPPQLLDLIDQCSTSCDACRRTAGQSPAAKRCELLHNIHCYLPRKCRIARVLLQPSVLFAQVEVLAHALLDEIKYGSRSSFLEYDITAAWRIGRHGRRPSGRWDASIIIAVAVLPARARWHF